ncbi:hypothetical protein [Allobranchiibius sp. GilTou73]|uniref:hypothetical protein n=1 Tax=Allobranchiibius sp. GilTou73 TaxID=2904523 RepID=UPI001F3B57C3|nr:hypothetical protein [Allobranchiibius sp. GilTou73]UIJ33474.1 hypothetical protein LVQ62_09820 [Allobranchiibius sp. GilTou73]
MQQINETGKHPKVGVLEPLALPTCKSCANYVNSVNELKSTGSHFSDDAYIIKAATFPEAGNHDRVELACSTPAANQVSASGAVITSFPRVKRVAIVIFLRWSTFWRVEEIQNDAGAS